PNDQGWIDRSRGTRKRYPLRSSGWVSAGAADGGSVPVARGRPEVGRAPLRRPPQGSESAGALLASAAAPDGPEHRPSGRGGRPPARCTDAGEAEPAAGPVRGGRAVRRLRGPEHVLRLAGGAAGRAVPGRAVRGAVRGGLEPAERAAEPAGDRARAASAP